MSALTTVYDDEVAPAIATPSRNHCTDVLTGSGDHCPRCTRTVLPNATVPEIDARVTLRTGTGTLTCADVTDVGNHPAPPEAVTRTETRAPPSAAFSVYDDDVAPLITLPSRNHCTLVVTDAGSHVPVLTFSVEPTRTVPVTDGAVRFCTASGIT